ncbi:MAG: hypothetical protein ABL999_17625 [Pyrinomonadaceae bacterium]
MVYSVEEAQSKLEHLIAMAFNGELILIKQGDDIVRVEPVEDRLIPGKVWTAEDF